jgi:hypothetical protein
MTINSKGNVADFDGNTNHGNSFLFDLCISDKYGFQLFLQYLKSTRCEDNLLFLQSVFQLENMTDIENCAQIAKEIYKKFIKRGAINEINLANRIRRPMELYFELGDEDDAFDFSVFNDAKQAVLYQLKEDKFPSFVQTKAFQDFVHKKNIAISSI